MEGRNGTEKYECGWLDSTAYLCLKPLTSIIFLLLILIPRLTKLTVRPRGGCSLIRPWRHRQNQGTKRRYLIERFRKNISRKHSQLSDCYHFSWCIRYLLQRWQNNVLSLSDGVRLQERYASKRLSYTCSHAASVTSKLKAIRALAEWERCKVCRESSSG